MPDTTCLVVIRADRVVISGRRARTDLVSALFVPLLSATLLARRLTPTAEKSMREMAAKAASQERGGLFGQGRRS